MAGTHHFFYGTLQDPDLFAVVVGRSLTEFEHEPASLPGYRLVKVADEYYPCITPDRASRVDGIIVTGLGETETDRMRFFEGPEYEPTGLSVRLRSGEACPAIVQLAGTAVRLTDEPWSLSVWAASKPTPIHQAEAWMKLHGRYDYADPRLDSIWQEIVAATPTSNEEREISETPAPNP